MYLRAWDLYATHQIDFEDSLLIAQMERAGTKVVYSYDRGYDRVGIVKRLEP